MRWFFTLAISVLLTPALGLMALGAGQHPPTRSKSGTAQTVHTAAASGKNAPVSYREVVEPFLKANCTVCHDADNHSSGLVVETPASLFKGGAKSGSKVIVPGNAGASALVAYLRGQKQPRMPLNRAPIPETQIRQIEAWINQGAKVDTVKLGWPYVRPVARPIPHVKNTGWVRNPIDNFVLAKLEAHGLKPSPPAGKIALLRRIYADLIGTPPSPAEADAFLTDAAPNAYEKLVDRLLADPRYGERWGRHWLDLVRYADSDGFENDGARPHAWRYRDYVIRAFNSDKPYDRFLKEQIAGDELFPGDPDALVATGYARLGPWDALTPDHAQRWQDYLNDVTDTTGSVMLGLTVGCARCHNHKYDRISQADYYRLQAFYTPTKWVETRLANLTSDSSATRQQFADAESHLQPLYKERDELRAQAREHLRAQKQKAGQKTEISEGEVEDELRKEGRNRTSKYEAIRDQIEHWEDVRRGVEPVAEAVTDGGRDAPATHLLLRGNLQTPGPIVQPGFVASLTGGEETPAPITPPADGKTTGRRSALALWIASPDNPMTARVLVNRLWQHHFGRGIVGTPSDFGRNGDKPTHPELLDWLAARFIQDGWSLKKMHRLMLLSNTYQQSTQFNATSAKTDPLNTLFWRMNRIRLEGEALRDSILTVSGRLNPEQGGPGVYPKLSEEVLSTGSTHKWGESPEAEGLRRTIYVFQRRSLVLPIVEAFDGADMSGTCPRRAVTTIAPQALALFNGDFSREESRYFAERVRKAAGSDLASEIDAAYKIALVRRPSAAQQALALAFLQKQTQIHQQANHKDAAFAALADFCHVLINTNEFVYLD